MKLPGRTNRKQGLKDFSEDLISLGNKIGFRVSSRGWCYTLEGFGLITKAQFDKVENLINTCRRQGYLPIDFTAEEEGRRFSGIEEPDEISPIQHLANVLQWSLRCENFYTPNWWEGEKYYIQLIVEKIDLKTLFRPVCEKYHIPIATTKGWSSMLQRAEYAKRFSEAEEMGLECVLLYCGDHDPDGLRISDFLRSNLADLKKVFWNDGARGYDPQDLLIDRFGLNFDFIEDNSLSWIDNLITGSKKNLASPGHPSHYLEYVQDYLGEYGARKCEANALVVEPNAAEQLVQESIEFYLGSNSIARFTSKKDTVKEIIQEYREEKGIDDLINEISDEIDELED